MSNTSSPSFRCINCGHDLTDLRLPSTPTPCPRCNHETDPYNPLSSSVKRLNPIGVYAEIFTAAMLPGVGIAIASVVSPFLYILMWPTLIIPCFRSDRVLKQTPKNQRTYIIAILWIAWITGVVSGFLGLLSII